MIMEDLKPYSQKLQRQFQASKGLLGGRGWGLTDSCELVKILIASWEITRFFNWKLRSEIYRIYW